MPHAEALIEHFKQILPLSGYFNQFYYCISPREAMNYFCLRVFDLSFISVSIYGGVRCALKFEKNKRIINGDGPTDQWTEPLIDLPRGG